MISSSKDRTISRALNKWPTWKVITLSLKTSPVDLLCFRWRQLCPSPETVPPFCFAFVILHSLKSVKRLLCLKTVWKREQTKKEIANWQGEQIESKCVHLQLQVVASVGSWEATGASSSQNTFLPANWPGNEWWQYVRQCLIAARDNALQEKRREREDKEMLVTWKWID